MCCATELNVNLLKFFVRLYEKVHLVGQIG